MMIQILHEAFIRNAFITGTIISILCGVIGYFVILRSQAFAAHALSHISFAGATAAALLGVSPLLGMFSFSIIAALGMGALEKRLQGKDIEIGMILSFGLGLGVLFLKLYTNSASEAVNILFGSIFSITPNDNLISLLTSVFVIVVLLLIYRPLLFVSVDPELAYARGVPGKVLSLLFIVLLALTVAQAIQVVGVLLVFALLISPPAIAQHLVKRPLIATLLSVMLGIFFCWFGLFASIFSQYPVSFFVAAVSSLTYAIVIILSHRVSPHMIREQKHPGKEIHHLI